MSELCDFLLVWIKGMCESEEYTISPEVFDRAVSVIGTLVPLGMYFFVLFCLALAVVSIFKFIGGKRRV